MNDQIIVVDAMINTLMNKLFDQSMIDCVNVVILSDHGSSFNLQQRSLLSQPRLEVWLNCVLECVEYTIV